MNTINFLFVSVALTFATGFFVALIIWSTSQFLTPRENRTFSLHVFLAFLQKFKNHRGLGFGMFGENKGPVAEDSENKELYYYHHGEY